MTQQDDAIGSRLSRIEAQLARIEELLLSAGVGEGQNPSATQKQCYEAWIHYLNNTPEAVEAHLTAHEMAALKASINAQVPSDSQSYTQLFHRAETGDPGEHSGFGDRRGKHVSDAQQLLRKSCRSL